MSLPWITINEKLLGGVSLINNLPTNKFNQLLRHSTAEEQFTDDELQKLQESLKLNDTNLQLLLLSIQHIWKQSLKILIKPTILHEHLTKQLKFDNEKAEQFVKFWTNRINNDFDLNNTKYLDNKIAWELNLETAKILNNKELKPKARLQLTLNETNERIMLELDDEELVQFYNILENVQNKLDQIMLN